MWPILLPATAARLALTLAAQNLSTGLAPNKFYVVCANQDMYISQTGAAAAANGSAFVPARCPTIIGGSGGATLSVLGLVAGDVTVTQVDYFLRK